MGVRLFFWVDFRHETLDVRSNEDRIIVLNPRFDVYVRLTFNVLRNHRRS